MTDQHLCEHPDCGRPAPYGYICYQCVDDTRDWLNHITQHDLDTLLAIARRQERAPQLKTESKQPRTGSGQDALNIPVWTLWNDLGLRWPNMLNTLHRQDNAVHTCQQIQAGVTRALKLARPEEHNIDADEEADRQEKLASIRPLPPTRLAEFMRTRANVKVTGKQIQKWAERGHIHPAFTTHDGKHFYRPVDVLKTLDTIRPKTNTH